MAKRITKGGKLTYQNRNHGGHQSKIRRKNAQILQLVGKLLEIETLRKANIIAMPPEIAEGLDEALTGAFKVATRLKTDELLDAHLFILRHRRAWGKSNRNAVDDIINALFKVRKFDVEAFFKRRQFDHELPPNAKVN